MARRAPDLDQQVVDQLPVGVVVLDLEGRVLSWNLHAERLYGWPAAEAMGRPLGDFAVLPLDTGTLGDIRTQVTSGWTWEGESSVRHRDGHTVLVHATVGPLADEDGTVVALLCVSADVSERRRDERRHSLDQAIATVVLSSTTMAEFAPQLLHVACELLGWPYGGLWEVDRSGERLQSNTTWHVRDEGLAAFAAHSESITLGWDEGLPGRVWASGRPVYLTDALTDLNFPRAPVAAEAGLHGAFAVPVQSGPDVIGVLEFLDRQRLEPDPELVALMRTVGIQVGQFLQHLRVQEAVIESEARKTAIFAGALDCIVSIDHESRITDFNPAAERTFGYTRDEAVGQLLPDLIIPPELRQAHYDGLARYLETGEGPVIDRRVEVSAMRRDGTRFPVELTVTRIDVPGQACFTGYLRDITDRERASTELYESRERFAHLARTLQESLLPPAILDLPGLEVAARYRFASEGTEVGGDFYDLFETGRSDWMVVIGDVCGKGPEAASTTALARYTIRAGAMQTRRPKRVLSLLNEAMVRQHNDRFCTIALARVRPADSGFRVTVCCGGHPLPFVRHRDGRVEAIGHPGTLIGAFSEVRLAEHSVVLEPGEVIVLYTDGVTEARRGGQLFGANRLADLLVDAGGLGAAELAAHLEDEVLAFQGGSARDDVALVVLRVLAPE